MERERCMPTSAFGEGEGWVCDGNNRGSGAGCSCPLHHWPGATGSDEGDQPHEVAVAPELAVVVEVTVVLGNTGVRKGGGEGEEGWGWGDGCTEGGWTLDMGSFQYPKGYPCPSLTQMGTLGTASPPRPKGGPLVWPTLRGPSIMAEGGEGVLTHIRLKPMKNG